MLIHFNEYCLKREERETSDRKCYVWNAKSLMLSSSLVAMRYRGKEQTKDQFKALVDTLIHAYNGSNYEALVKQCVDDGHCKSEENAQLLTITDAIFSLSVGIRGGWLIKLLDYTKYEQAMEGIAKGLRILAEHGYFKEINGFLSVQDKDKAIWYHVVFVAKDTSFYQAYHSAYKTMDCYAKATGPTGDLFIFRYEEPVSYQPMCLAGTSSTYEDRSLDLRIKIDNEFGVPVTICRTTDLKENVYKIHVGLSGRTHSLAISQWRFPLCIVLTAPTLHEALSKLHHIIINRGINLVDFEHFKEAVKNAKEY